MKRIDYLLLVLAVLCLVGAGMAEHALGVLLSNGAA